MLFDAKLFCDKENNVSFTLNAKTIHHKGYKLNKNGKEKLLRLTGAQIASLQKANARSKSKLIFLEKKCMKVELMTWSAKPRQKTVKKTSRSYECTQQ